MRDAFKIVRTLQWALLGSIVVYATLGAFIRPSSRSIDPALTYVLTTLGVAIVGVIFVVRRTLVLRAAETLTKQPGDVISLSHWKTGYLWTYALCEALALFGLVERFMGAHISQSVSYYIGGFALILFFRPQMPQAAPTT